MTNALRDVCDSRDSSDVGEWTETADLDYMFAFRLSSLLS
jgi:hypothetical protein